MTRFAIAAALIAAVTTAAAAQDWLDNFNDGDALDGSPVTWVPSPAFGSEFEVVDGDLRVTMVPGRISSPRVDSYFPGGASVRARMVAFDGPGRYTVAFADQETGIKGYVASFTTCQHRLELFRGDRLGQIVFIGPSVTMPYQPFEEFYIQLDVFDGVVSARLWRPGEPFPAAQISADDARYPDGVASIAIQDFGSGDPGGCGQVGNYLDTSAIVRFAQASSTPLTHSGCGDFNADGETNSLDVGDFLQSYAAQGSESDVNGDGLVNGLDVGMFAHAYATGC